MTKCDFCKKNEAANVTIAGRPVCEVCADLYNPDGGEEPWPSP